MIAIITVILCWAMRNQKKKKKPHRPNHTKADGVKRKGREHYGSDMLIFVFMQTECQHNGETRISRMFHEFLSRDRETGNPLVVDAACGARLSGAQRARRRRSCHLVTCPAVPRDWSRGVPEWYVAGGACPELVEGTPEDTRKDGRTRCGVFAARRYSIGRAGPCYRLSQGCIMFGMGQWLFIIERDKKNFELAR